MMRSVPRPIAIGSHRSRNDIRIENNGDAKLRGGTGSASVRAVTAHNLNGVIFTPSAAERCLLDLSIKLLIFPDFKSLFHKLLEQTHRIAASLACSRFKAYPQCRI